MLDFFNQFHEAFKRITRRSRARFERREWHAVQRDSVERLDLYRTVVDACVQGLKQQTRHELVGPHLWPQVKGTFSRLIARERDGELAETFFNSVSRRLINSIGVEPSVQFVDTEVDAPSFEPTPEIFTTYPASSHTAIVLRQILADLGFEVGYEDLDRDAHEAAAAIDEQLRGMGIDRYEAIDVVRPLFYRNKGCYLVGRVRRGSALVPLVLPLLHGDDGIFVDAVLLEPGEVSIVFSFTRSYFFVDTDRPSDLIAFLRSIMPVKPLNELYNSLGFNKHGKTLLYRDLTRHLMASDDRFVIARGERGMVMLVFTLPSFDVVFKIIRDTFDYPKTTTRDQVKQQYRLVFTHDRAGRLVDAQEFQGLTFKLDRFTPELVEELRNEASFSTQVVGDEVVINHMYTERRLVPLNVYLGEAPHEAAMDAVVDYGNAIKDLISANIFPGDLLLKNFGVTRQGRVVFYDYDELCLITDCNFRAIPPAQSVQDELWSTPWYSVAENDIFPEELRYFLGLSGELREVYERHHADLFEVTYWQGVQQRLREGWIADIYPYKDGRRLRNHANSNPHATLAVPRQENTR